jgi:hypothetical protein
MMITKNNYYEIIKTVNLSNAPEVLRKGAEYVDRATRNGTNWDAYKNSAIKDVIDTYFEKLGAFVKKQNPSKNAQPKVQKEQIKHEPKQRQEHKPLPVKASDDRKLVEHFPEEFKFIRRFVNMDGKTKDKKQMLNFINALQRSITEKRMSKTSPYKKQIDFIQNSLIRNYNSMRAKMKVELSDKIVAEYKEILGEEKIYPSVLYIKKFINLHGKQGIREKAQKLLASIERAMNKGQFLSTDKYVPKVKEVYKVLEKFLSTKGAKSIEVESAQLNGLLGACGCSTTSTVSGLSGVDYGGKKPSIMTSTEFANLHFQKLGFNGKWRNFLGDPAPGFTMMVYSLPKYGKSTLCLNFAAYLARNHGKVLYVAREEGLDATLQDKVKDPSIMHHNLLVSSFLPDDLSQYDFIFLDSVNKLGLSPNDLEILKRKNPGKSFVYIFQTTKQGRFKGNNEFQHDVDIVVELPEIGNAVQYGRFNAMSEMRVFEN